jgi:hypothetical protein
VVIDEAYVDFGAETAIPLVASHPNLLVVQTMSKSRALAGLRVGYAIGDADLIEALTRVKDSFNSYPLGRPAQAGAIASLQDEAWFQQSRARVIEGRERLNRGLVRLGFEVLPSCANFVFARHPALVGAALAAALRQRAMIVRHFPRPASPTICGSPWARTDKSTGCCRRCRTFWVASPDCASAPSLARPPPQRYASLTLLFFAGRSVRSSQGSRGRCRIRKAASSSRKACGCIIRTGATRMLRSCCWFMAAVITVAAGT